MNTVYIVAGVVFLIWIVGNIFRRAHHKNKIIQVIDDNCIGCGRCIKRCNHRVLALKHDGNVNHLVIRNPGRCTGCGDCIGKCKFNALKLVEK